jgi:hypothetical protein
MYLVRANADGTEQWSQYYGDNAPRSAKGLYVPAYDEMAYGVAPVPTGGYVLCGFYDRVVRVKEDSVPAWTFRGGSGLTTCVFANADGGVLAAGIDGIQDILDFGPTALRKLDADGNLLWRQSFGTGRINCMAAAPDGGIVVAGTLSPEAFLVAKIKPEAAVAAGR